MDEPWVGATVHYVSFGTPGGEYRSQCRAATVSEVDSESTTLGLVVLNPTGLFFRSLSDGGCPLDEDAKAGGSWHWPERPSS